MICNHTIDLKQTLAYQFRDNWNN